MSVAAQRAWKRQHVGEVLRRTGNISESALVPVNEVYGTEQVLGYRSKITPHHEKPRNVGRGGLQRIWGKGGRGTPSGGPLNGSLTNHPS